MAYKTLKLTVISARDLKKADVYTTVSLFGDSGYPYNMKQKTPVHPDGGNNPRWNYTVVFTVDEAKLANLKLVFDLEQKRIFFRDKKVGQVVVWVNNLLRKKAQMGDSTFSYKVRTRSGADQGLLDFSVKLSDSDSVSNANLTPPPPPPPVVEAGPWPEQTSWVSAYRGHRHQHGQHRRHRSW